MKHLHLFEAWSHQWKNLQKAYSNRLETGVQQGRSARRLMDFAKKKVTEDKFRVTDAAGNEFLFHLNPEFLVTPLQFLDEHFRYSDSIVVPIVVDAINKIPIPPVNNPKSSIEISKRREDGKPEMKLCGEMDYMSVFNVFTGGIKTDLSKLDQETADALKSMAKNFQNLPEKDRSLVSSSYPTVRFSNQRELEDFLGTYVQAIISDPIDKESANGMWGKLLGDTRLANLGGFPIRPEEGLNRFFKSKEEQDLSIVTDSFLKNALVYEINSLMGQFDPRYFM